MDRWLTNISHQKVGYAIVRQSKLVLFILVKDVSSKLLSKSSLGIEFSLLKRSDVTVIMRTAKKSSFWKGGLASCESRFCLLAIRVKRGTRREKGLRTERQEISRLIVRTSRWWIRSLIKSTKWAPPAHFLVTFGEPTTWYATFIFFLRLFIILSCDD